MARNKGKRLAKREFSKTLLIQESALIWVISLSFIFLAFICVWKGYTGSLPWLAAMVSFPWAAYGVSQMFYYKKSTAENTDGGIKFQSMMQDVQKQQQQYTAYTEEPEIDINGPI